MTYKNFDSEYWIRKATLTKKWKEEYSILSDEVLII